MRLKGKSVLVTGSSGFVGKLLVKRLRDCGAKVSAFDLINGKDITQWKHLQRLRKVDVVCHLAAITFVPNSHNNPRLAYEVNVLGTLNVLEYCRMKGARMVFASSYVYGNPDQLPVDEKHPVKPTNPYARSKVMGEILCLSYHEDYGVPCTILRPFNIYGSGQEEHFLIPEIARQLKAGNVITLKDLTPKRDVVHIDDAVSAYVKAAEYNTPGYDVFNIGYGKSYSVKEIAGKMIRLSGKDVRLKSLGEKRKGEIRDTIADIRKAKRLLKWRPAINIDKGLERVLTGE